VIEIERISRAFGGLQAVREVSFTVEPGSITGLIGPNGAGKSTLFNIVAGALAPDSGRIRLDGEDITGLPTHQLFHKGLVRTFQIPHEFSRMSVRENLMLVPAAQSGENLLRSWLTWWKVIREDRACCAARMRSWNSSRSAISAMSWRAISPAGRKSSWTWGAP